jgi:hypothetical protein
LSVIHFKEGLMRTALGWALPICLLIASCGGEEPTSLQQDSKTCGLKGYPECTDCIKGEQGDLMGTAPKPVVTDAGPAKLDFGPSPAPSAHCKKTGEWKSIAIAACKARGLELTKLEVDKCCGEDSFLAVQYECCPKALPPPPPPPICKPDDPTTPLVNEDTCGKGLVCVGGKCVVEPPPPPPPTCVKDGQGGPTSCKPSSLWKQYASDACKAKGMVLDQFGPYEPCGTDLFRYVSYICCDSQPPPPPTCKPDDPSTPLVNEDTCGKGQVCVGGKCEPVPPPPPSCTNLDQGGPTSCKTTATWKQYAYDTCKAAGLDLKDYKVYDSCGVDLSRHVSFICCKPAAPPACKPDDPSTPLVYEDTCATGEACIGGICVPLAPKITTTKTMIGTRPCYTEAFDAQGQCYSLPSWNAYLSGRAKLCTSSGWVVNSSGVIAACFSGYLSASLQCCAPK